MFALPKNLSATVKNIVSFEAFFVLFLFADQVKLAYPFTLVPHLSLLLVGLLTTWTVLLLRKQGMAKVWRLEPLLFLGFSLWCLASAYWVKPSTYSLSKALCFGVYTVPTFFMAYLIIGGDDVV